MGKNLKRNICDSPCSTLETCKLIILQLKKQVFKKKKNKIKKRQKQQNSKDITERKAKVEIFSSCPAWEIWGKKTIPKCLLGRF